MGGNLMDERDKDVASAERRNFLKLVGTGSFTTAMIVGAGGMLWSDAAIAQTSAEERDRQNAADHIMTLATAYVLSADRSYPIMQLDLKENIQNLTNGKVYVRLAPGGQLGAGGALAQAVQSGTVQCAQHSLANFAPFASVVDLINLPYFCGSNQRFTNLTSSDTWKAQVDPKIAASGFKALFYIVIDPRVVAVRQGGNAILTPADMSGVKFRVPGSEMLQQYYRMVGANPTPVAWGETPSAIRQGVADALDPSVGALHVFGFGEILSHVTFTPGGARQPGVLGQSRMVRQPAGGCPGRDRACGRDHASAEPRQGARRASVRDVGTAVEWRRIPHAERRSTRRMERGRRLPEKRMGQLQDQSGR